MLQLFEKKLLVSLGLTTAALAADSESIQKILCFGTTTLIVSNEEMNNVIKMVKSLKISGLLLKGVAKTNENKTREQRTGVLIMLLGTLGASLLQIFYQAQE